MNAAEEKQLKELKSRLESGELMDQRCWSFIRDLNSYSDERLDSIAIRDGYRTYTYRQMFRYWEKYAEAFSAVNITGENNSRAALIGTPITETIFAFYGLNMTGASVSLIYHFDLYDDKNINSMIRKENITDLIVSEMFAFPKLMKRLLRDREMLGLRNIIVLKSSMGGEFAIPALEALCNMNASMFRALKDGYLMEDLLRDYEAYPISYGDGKSSDASVVLHTTGTVSGIHKPVPLSDKAMNNFVACALKAKEMYKDFKAAPKHMVSCLTLNMAWVYAMVDMLHTSLGLGMEVVTIPIGGTNPRYAQALEKYGVSILFTSKAILDSWNKTMPDIDLSKLKVIFMGGSYVSPEFKKSFNDYLESCGSSARIINGYGLSEMGGASIIAPSDREDDAIGYPLPGFKVKIFSEDENKFYDLEDGPNTGVLYLSSPTMSSGRIGDTVFFELEKIGDDYYFNSNDLVRVNEDGSMTCIGRSNKFFVNNAGVRFDAGLVETAVSSQPGITACGITPEFHKMLHDNVPILYVETSGDKADELVVVRKSLIQVFINDGKLEQTNMPSQCVLTDTIPLNTGGKVDAKKLASGTVTGRRFHVKPVKIDGKLTDILLLPATEGEDATMGAGVPEELVNDPYNILGEVFALIPDISKGRFSKFFKIPGLREMVMKLTDFDIKNFPESMKKLAPELIRNTINGDRKLSDAMNSLKGIMPMFMEADSTMPSMPFMPMLPPMPMMPMMPMMPPMFPMPGVAPFGWSGRKDEGKKNQNEQWDDFKLGMDTFYEQVRDMQNSSMDTSREHWQKFFDYMMDLQEAFVSSLPDENPSMPGMPPFMMPPMSFKAFMEKMIEYQKIANSHAMEQADSFFKFCRQGQEQVKGAVSEAARSAEDEKANEDT